MRWTSYRTSRPKGTVAVTPPSSDERERRYEDCSKRMQEREDRLGRSPGGQAFVDRIRRLA
jgi:hypothetical protein